MSNTLSRGLEYNANIVIVAAASELHRGLEMIMAHGSTRLMLKWGRRAITPYTSALLPTDAIVKAIRWSSIRRGNT
jgi:hypothetical protein